MFYLRHWGTTQTRGCARSSTRAVQIPIEIRPRTVPSRLPQHLSVISLRLPTTFSPALGALIYQPMLLAGKYWERLWKRFSPGRMTSQSGQFRAHLGSLAPQKTILMASSQLCVLGSAQLAPTAQRMPRLSRYHAHKATTAQLAQTCRCHAKRARTRTPLTSQAPTSALTRCLATMRQQAVPSRHRAALARNSLKQRRGGVTPAMPARSKRLRGSKRAKRAQEVYSALKAQVPRYRVRAAHSATKQEHRAAGTAALARPALSALLAPPQQPVAARAPTPQRREANSATHVPRASTRATWVRQRAASVAMASRAQRARSCRSRRRALRACTWTRRPTSAPAARLAACARAARRSRGRAPVAATAWPACRSRPTAPRGAMAA